MPAKTFGRLQSHIDVTPSNQRIQLTRFEAGQIIRFEAELAGELSDRGFAIANCRQCRLRGFAIGP